MKVIKNINNNVSLCMDSKGREVIAFGKGIGFIRPPYEIPLNKVERTFYSSSYMDFEGIKDIPLSIMNASIRIVDEVEASLNITLMSTAALTLADHIQFAIQRLDKHILLEMAVQEDVKQLYPDEMREAYKALEIIKEETGVMLARNEAATIALHFINNQIVNKENNTSIAESIINESVRIVEKEFDITINKESFNYSRYATHIDYLLKRTVKGNQIESVNLDMFKSLKEQYASTYECAVKISNLFERKLNISLSDEENIYLMLHINRLCSREKVSN